MSTDLRQQLVDIAMEPDREYQRLRIDLAAAELAVTVLVQEQAKLSTRLTLAKAHVRHLRDEYTLKYGVYI